MRNWMKQLNRVIVLGLMVVCLFGYLGVEADAYGTYTSSGTTYIINDDTVKWGGDSGWLVYNNGSLVKSSWVLSKAGLYYFVDGNGDVVNGWNKIDDYFYYFSGWVMQTGWQTIDNKTYFLNDKVVQPDLDSGVMLTGWQEIDGFDYYFNSSGHMVTDKWEGAYWLGSDGKMATSTWVDNDNYYVDSEGKYVTGWFYYNNHWYFLNDGTINGYKNGQMIEPSSDSWIKIGSYYYYFYKAGQLAMGETNGWLFDTYMLNTTAADPASGKYSRMTGWVSVGTGENKKEYYLDPNSSPYPGAMLKDSWAPPPDGPAYVGSDGKKVYGEWVKDDMYYIHPKGAVNEDGESIEGVYATSWQKIPDKNGVMHWYRFNDRGKKEIGWVDGHKYYLDPNSTPVAGAMVTGYKVIDGSKYYFNDDGSVKYNTPVTYQDVEYWATYWGIMVPKEHYHYLINPYFDTIPGGLYDPNSTSGHTAIKDSSIYKGDTIPSAYNQISIGGKAAKNINVRLPNGVGLVSKGAGGWNGAGDVWAWEYSGNQVVNASVEKREDINGKLSAEYTKIATLKDEKGDIREVNLIITVLDYAVVSGKGQTPVLAFNTRGQTPGVLGMNISWVQLKYDLVFADTGEPIPSGTKGNTTYYDVDAYQSVCFNDSTNKGIYARSDACELSVGTVSGHGTLDGNCVYFNDEAEFDDVTEQYLGGFTEIFEGNTLTRTFSFKNDLGDPDNYYPYTYDSRYFLGTAGGVILNSGQPVSTGSLKISKTVSPESSETFNFTIELTNAPELDAVYSGVIFEDGKAYVSLKHGEYVTISGIPAGIEYKVTEAAYDDYVSTATGATGTIATDITAAVEFQNWAKRTLTVKKNVAGTEEAKNSDVFTFKLTASHGQVPVSTSYTLSTGETKTLGEGNTFTLMHGQTATFTLPEGANYTVTETKHDGYLDPVVTEGDSTGIMNGNKNVTFTNTQLLKLTVKKVLEGETAEDDRQFKITVAYTLGNNQGGGEQELLGGETKTWLVPYGASYTVTEEAVPGYTTTYSPEASSDSLTADDTTVTVTNSAKEYELTVEKVVVGDTNAQNKEFTFTLAVTRQSGIQNFTPKTYVKGGETYNLGEGNTFTLKHGETATIAIPEGWTYTVVESDPGENYTDPEYVINTEGGHKVTVTNTQLVTLTLTKQVGGNMGEKEREFKFTVKLGKKAEGNETGTQDNEGNFVYTVNLAHDQSAVFTVPYGTAYEITESDYSGDGYDTEIFIGDSEDGIESLTTNGNVTAATTVTYENNKGFSIPTGLTVAVLPFLGMVLFGGGIGITQLLGGRKSCRGRYLDR